MKPSSAPPPPINRARVGFVAAALAAALLAGCADPPAPASVDFAARAEARRSGPVAVRAVALGPVESVAAFGIDMNAFDIQPVWIDVENEADHGFWLFPYAVDEDYYPPYEAARRVAQFEAESTDQIHARLVAAQIPLFVPPRERVQGFVFATDDEGAKSFSVVLRAPQRDPLTFHFLSPVPGLDTDYLDAPRERLLDPTATDLDDAGLRRWIEAEAPATTRAADGAPGDPLNIVMIGTLEATRDALISAGWDATAPITAASIRRIAASFLFGGRYRYAPISDLYVFDMQQDLAFQRARPTIVERNHLRLWLAPVRHQGRPVWIGQISRDDGVKFSGRVWPPTTHVIDPDVDEARFFLLQNLMHGDRLARFAYAAGAPDAPIRAPARNAEGDTYFSDGFRAVFFLSEDGDARADATYEPWTPLAALAARAGRTP
jgi:hypothetical protein